IKAGDFSLAERLLGRPYAISRLVSRGKQLGRTLNYPTANIVLGEGRFAVNGVYAVRILLSADRLFHGVANVGKRPTVDGRENRLEVHIFDFDADIYGTKLQVEFKRKIRDEQKFDSIEALQRQIQSDAGAARAYFINKGA
ncbi:MAG: bifunctional riboflavin kinase/FAD synthetase, partial [Gammaproteobacteria bacterium]|nr:bifunctional riboflavin kinase/FAD synthetase [Gammaproteobacteria bacterium]